MQEVSPRLKVLLAFIVPFLIAIFLVNYILHSVVDGSHVNTTAVNVERVSLFVTVVLVLVAMVGIAIAHKIISLYEQSQKELQEMHDDLDNRVKERTEKLLKSEARYKTLFENTEISIWNEDLSHVKKELESLKKQGVTDLREYLYTNKDVAWYMTSLVEVKHVNEATLNLFQARSEEQLLFHIEKTFGEGAIDIFIDEVCAIWDGKQHFRSEAKFITFEGVEFSALVSMPIPSKLEDYINVPFTIINISDRVEYADRLARSEVRLNEAQRIAHLGSWELQIDTGDLYWSNEVYHIFEIEDRTLSNSYEKFLSLVHPEDREYVELSFQNSVEKNLPYNIIHRLLMPDGRIKYVNERCENHYDEFGKAIRSVGTVHDITDRIIAEEALRESEKRLRNYVESAPVGIFVVNEKGEYIDINSAGCEITGYSREEIIGLNINDLTYEEDRQIARDSFRHVVLMGRASTELRFIRKNGSVGYWVVDAVKLADNQYLGFTNDITDKRELEGQLRQSEKMRAIGQLAGGIAHDFNNQLTGILGHAELLREELEQKDVKDVVFVKDIIQGVERASNLTAQLLAFSRKGKYLTKVVDVHQLVNEVCRLLERTIDKKITIQTGLNAKPATTLGDPTLLQNAILNLAINARDALPGGGEIEFHSQHKTLDIEFMKRHSLDLVPGEYILLTVADNGIGMESKICQRIFEPFFTTKEQGKGTGMGLAAVYGTIKSHNGVILVESRVGKGTIFSVYLPFTNKIMQEDVVVDKPKEVTRKSAHVLVVDDDEVVRSVIARMLKKEGFTVDFCEDGVDAVDYFKDHWQEIDLIILDLVMPIMGGKMAFPLLKDIDPDVKVLVSSGYSIEGEAQSVLDMGALGFLQKPFQKEQLAATIHELLHHDEESR